MEQAVVSGEPAVCDEQPVSFEGFSSVRDAQGTIDVDLKLGRQPCTVGVEFCRREISVDGSGAG